MEKWNQKKHWKNNGFGTQNGSKIIENRSRKAQKSENFRKKLFFGGADFWRIFEIEKNEKKVGRRGRWDPALESAHSAGNERSKGGTKLT